MPRRGAPQAPQGPGSEKVADREASATAKTESSFSTRGLEQFLQTGSAAEEFTIFSNLAPHARHRYSKIGTFALPVALYRNPSGFSIAVAGKLRKPRAALLAAAFFLPLRNVAPPE